MFHVVALVCLPLVTLAPDALGQQAAGATPPTAEGKTPAPGSAPAATESAQPMDVSGRSQKALERLAQLSDAAQSPASDDATEWLATLTSDLNELGALDEIEQRLVALSRTQLEDLAKQLGDRRKELANRSTDLDQRAQELEAQLQEIAGIGQTWQEVRKTQTDLPKALTDRVDAIIAQVPKVSAMVQDKLNGVAELQNKAIALNDQMDAIADRVQRHREELQRALFSFRHPPIWAMHDTLSEAAYQQTASDIARRWSRHIDTFMKEHAGDTLLHLATLVLILLAIRALKVVAERGGVEPDETRILQRPMSSGILIALLLQGVFYVNAPSTITVALGIATAITAVVVLYPFLQRAMRVTLIVLVALFVVDRVLTLFTGGTAPQRLVLLLLSLSMVGLSAVARREEFTDELDRRGLPRWITRPAFAVGLLLSALAVALNVLGNVELATLLTAGVIRGLLSLIVIFTVYRMANDLLTLLLRPGFITRFRAIVRHRERLTRAIRRPIVWAAVIGWCVLVASFFDLLAPLANLVRRVLAAEAQLGDINVSLGRVVAFGLALWVAVVASRVTRAILSEDVLPRFALPRGVPNTIGVTVNYAIVLIGLLIGAGFLGINLTSLGLILGALGVGIGFGLQNIVNNFVSGLILVFERPIQVGDIVEVDTLFGRVTQIGLRASRVRTFSGSEIIVPNADLVSLQVTNWTLSDRRRRLELVVGVAYASDPEQVHDVLMEVVTSDEEVLQSPEPMVVFEEFGDSALQFRVYCWIADFDQSFVMRNKLLTRINTALKNAGIEIPFPQRDLHLRSIQTAEPLHVDGRRADAREDGKGDV